MGTAHRDKRIGGYHYKGFYFDKPEGCKYWNVHKVENGIIDFCFSEAHCETFKECKETIDCMTE